MPSLIKRYASTCLPTEYGEFNLCIYNELANGAEHCALWQGELSSEDPLPTRVHSECLTGEVFHSLKCDCREQLDLALRRIAEEGRGLLLYLRQEGRGIGLGNKIRAYALQSQGMDTVDANRALGFPDDLRSYDVAAEMLRDLGVDSIALMTNNPDKLQKLKQLGIDVSARQEHVIPANQVNRSYLETKAARMGHLFDIDAVDKPKDT